MSSVPDVQRLRPARLRQTTFILADAFYDDPVSRFLLPDEGSRRRWLALLHEAYLRMIMPEGHVYAIGDGQVEGAIGVLPPGRYPIAPHRTLAYLARVIWNLPSGGFPLGRARRALQAQQLVERLHIRERHWYVSVLGVQPSRQGAGLGRTLLDPIVARADSDRLPTYLETSNERNLSFYGRFGFQVLREVAAPGGGPPVWTMLRRPVG